MIHWLGVKFPIVCVHNCLARIFESYCLTQCRTIPQILCSSNARKMAQLVNEGSSLIIESTINWKCKKCFTDVDDVRLEGGLDICDCWWRASESYYLIWVRLTLKLPREKAIYLYHTQTEYFSRVPLQGCLSWGWRSFDKRACPPNQKKSWKLFRTFSPQKLEAVGCPWDRRNAQRRMWGSRCGRQNMLAQTSG